MAKAVLELELPPHHKTADKQAWKKDMYPEASWKVVFNILGKDIKQNAKQNKLIWPSL